MVSEKQLRKVKISADLNEVFMAWEESRFLATEESSEEGEDTQKIILHTVVGHERPHANLVKALKSLRKHAFAVNEMTVDSTELSQWTVGGIDIAGNVDQKKSRVVMTLLKSVKRTGKVIPMKTCQVTMFPQADDTQRYHDAEKLAVLVEDVIQEAFEYLTGKFEDVDDDQLALFPMDRKIQTNFKH